MGRNALSPERWEARKLPARMPCPRYGERRLFWDRRGSRARNRLQDHGRAGERIPARCVADAGENLELSVDLPVFEDADHERMERFPALAAGCGP